MSPHLPTPILLASHWPMFSNNSGRELFGCAVTAYLDEWTQIQLSMCRNFSDQTVLHPSIFSRLCDTTPSALPSLYNACSTSRMDRCIQDTPEPTIPRAHDTSSPRYLEPTLPRTLCAHGNESRGDAHMPLKASNAALRSTTDDILGRHSSCPIGAAPTKE
jgi:hypothetical protein